VCSVRLSDFSGVVESPNYPFPYESWSNCEWVIEATAGNTLNVSFTRIDLQPGVGGQCNADYVEVL